MRRTKTNPYRRFVALTAAGGLAFLATLLPSMWRWQPFDGGQTRVSGLSELDYGWNRPQEFFPERLYRVVDSPDGYDKHYDIVVVGDSFSGRAVNNLWLDYLTDRTGASVLCIWSGRARDIETVANHRVFRADPPRLVIFESVERSLIPRLASVAALEVRTSSTVRSPPLTLSPTNAKAVTRERPKTIDFWKRVQEVAASMQTRMGLRLEADRVRVVPLDSSKLFSSRRSDELLVLGLDEQKHKVGAQDVERAAVGLRNMRAYIEGNGKTRFLLVAFPDKSSQYAPYIENADATTPNLIGALADQATILRLDELFAEELRRGHVDLYLPDDSHTSATGSRLAADLVVQALVADGTFRR